MGDPIDLAIMFVVAGPMFLLALVFHEYCHALVAARLGDKLAAWTGRLTMDPKVHLDPIGSVAAPAIGLIFGWLNGVPGFVFGWARPVPFNPRDLRRPQRDTMLIALAGPVANFALMIAFASLIRGLTASGLQPGNPVLQMAAYGVYINALLGVFNLIPLPPLDGSKILAFFLGPEMGRKLLAINPGIALLIIFYAVYRGILTTPLLTVIAGCDVLAGARVLPLML